MAQPTKETSTTGACSVPAPAIPVAALTMPLPPDTLLAGVEEAIAGHLGISNLRHRSAVYKLERAGGVALVSGMFDKIRSNYSGCGATTRKNRSSQNWRWQSLQPQIGADNRSSEVIVERAIAAACMRLGRTDWANQVPVASGLLDGKRYGRRAIDLVRQRGQKHFEFIELKIASDTPLYAAIEIIGHACLWLIARDDRPARPSALLDAECIDVRVLAPGSFYARLPVSELGTILNVGLEDLGLRQGVAMSFAFSLLDERVKFDAIPGDTELLDCLDRSTLLNVVHRA
jgi:hypothetical protein